MRSARPGPESAHRPTILPRMLAPLTTLLALVGLLAATPAPTAAQHFPPDDDLQVMLDYLVTDGAAPGVVLGIIEPNGSTRVLTAGTGGPDTAPLGPESVFEIGSINKTFTGVLLADMVLRGEVALDDPISMYLPDHVRAPSRSGREITLEDLATHRSGLPRLPDNYTPTDMADPYAGFTVELLYEFLDTHELRRDPGAEAEYSNLGFGLLGHLLARAASDARAPGPDAGDPDLTYRELLHQRVLEPLGMGTTQYELEGTVAERMTRGHSAQGVPVAYWFTTEAIEGAGGLRSSLDDMLAYLGAHMNPDATELGDAIRLAIRQRESVSETAGIGLGWQTADWEGRRIVTHGGATGGFSARIGLDRDTGAGFVLLANTGGFPDDVGLDLLRFGPYVERPVAELDPSLGEAYEGVYQVSPSASIYVRHEGGGTLTFQNPGNVRFRMYAESDSSFFLKRAPWRVVFTRGESGEIDGLDLIVDDNRRTHPRTGGEPPPPGTPAAETVLDLPLTEDDIARYEGTYGVEVGMQTMELRIFGQDGALMSQVPGQSVSRLRSQGDHVFAPDFDDTVRLIFTVREGRAVSVALHQSGGVFTGERR